MIPTIIHYLTEVSTNLKKKLTSHSYVVSQECTRTHVYSRRKNLILDLPHVWKRSFRQTTMFSEKLSAFLLQSNNKYIKIKVNYKTVVTLATINWTAQILYRRRLQKKYRKKPTFKEFYQQSCFQTFKQIILYEIV